MFTILVVQFAKDNDKIILFNYLQEVHRHPLCKIVLEVFFLASEKLMIVPVRNLTIIMK